MMKFLSRLHRRTDYKSLVMLESKRLPGVQFAIRKPSLGQRIELSSRTRELALKNEFLRSGDIADQLDATTADLLVQRLYLEWAVINVSGIKIDGQPATVALLIERGPEALVAEMLGAVADQLELSEAERKNC